MWWLAHIYMCAALEPRYFHFPAASRDDALAMLADYSRVHGAFQLVALDARHAPTQH